ncbi:SpaH/EbpB family LPXTG-anchored major pilin [uncultured Leuconostoc sp.]|uniref:SpaH/EbpB family LPXTG-anchored major pilin n=1 Tax=uncultured Leuconostoc sp. TaxID=173262 RepID=UPI002804C5B6|nr:SpaH/EbpB family LPXTG-anchored major pilin [uncultured Leuconostoc sp.]
MKRKTWSTLANTILLVLPLLLSAVLGVANVSADSTDTVNVTLHKRVFDEGQVPANKTNTGDVDSSFGGTPLAGVTFTAYDVTDHYLALRKGGQTAEEATQAVQKDAVDKAPSYANQVGQDVTKGADGTVTFSNLASKDGDKDKVYLFVETNSPTDITQKADPIVLALPIYKTGSDSEINTNIHVYPKNEKSTAITKDLNDKSKTALEVTLGDSKVYNATFGQTFGYQLQIAVPWNIADKLTFNVVDTPNLGIDDDASTVQVAGLTKGTDYKVEASAANDQNGKGFKITFDTSTAAVKEAAGKKLTITYDATLTNAAVPDKALNNTATLNIGNGTDVTSTPTQGPAIYTGGINFVKQDKQSGKTLANAEFQLVKLNANGDKVAYATQASDGSYNWAATADGATTYTSDSKGAISLKGLAYSTKFSDGQSYALVETKAPEGYALLTAPVKFTVTQGSFDVTKPMPITNIKKGILPSTGGSGIYLFLIIGALMMGAAYLWNKRNKKEQNI